MATPPGLFRNVHDRDYLGFWARPDAQARGSRSSSHLKKPDVAKVAGVAPSSVRFDQKIPREVYERLEEIANICALVAAVLRAATWRRRRCGSGRAIRCSVTSRRAT